MAAVLFASMVVQTADRSWRSVRTVEQADQPVAPSAPSAGRRCSSFAVPVALGLVLVALLVDVAALAVDLVRSRRLEAGGTLSTIGLDFSDDLSQAANYALAGSLALAAILFGLWFLCSYRRLRRVGLARWPAPWAIVGWLIPLVNLAAPPSIMDELATPQGRGHARSSGGIIGGWWFLWIFGAVLAAGLRALTSAPADVLDQIAFSEPATQAQWTTWFALAIVADLAMIVAVICALILVRRVVRAQDRLLI
jgi:hypothetical protein